MRALLAVLLLLCLAGCAHRAQGWGEWEQHGGRWVESERGE